mgnify:FL=1
MLWTTIRTSLFYVTNRYVDFILLPRKNNNKMDAKDCCAVVWYCDNLTAITRHRHKVNHAKLKRYRICPAKSTNSCNDGTELHDKRMLLCVIRELLVNSTPCPTTQFKHFVHGSNAILTL